MHNPKKANCRNTDGLRAYIPAQWPLPDILNQLVRKSSGQFIYASIVTQYVSSIRHNPTDRLDIILGIRPPQRDSLPFAELDALYRHILANVEEIEPILEILSFLFFYSFNPSGWKAPEIEEFLALQPGAVELYLGDLSSLVSIAPDKGINILHASLTDFLVDPTRSKELWINCQARHTVFARRCLQSLQLKGQQYRSSYIIPILTPKQNMPEICHLVFSTPSTISKMRK